jgi:hypothetical protein
VKVAIFCAAVALLIGVAIVTRDALQANRGISLCWDTSAPDYIKDDKLREASCKN